MIGRQRTASLAVAALLFAAIFGLRVTVGTPADALAVLFVIPIMIVAVQYGLLGGLATAAVALGLFGVYAAVFSNADDEVTAAGWLSRALLFVVVGAAVGRGAEELLRVQRERGRYFDMARDKLCTVGFDGRFRDVNAAWATTLGWQPDDMCRRAWADFVHPEDVERTSEQMAKLTAGGDIDGFANRFRTPGGEWRWLEWRARGHREAKLIYASARDVTEVRREKDELLATIRELERSNSELEQFAYVTSHDLSEPLRSLHGYADLLMRGYADAVDDRGRRYLANIQESTRRLQALYDDLLAYSRAGLRELVLEEVDAGQLVQEEVRRVVGQRRAGSGDVVIGTLPRVVADVHALRLAFANLIANAVKFSGPEPRLEIGAEEGPDGWGFSVADRGIGVDPRFAERIFQVFQRLHASGEYAGTGIGLAICRRVIERHGGRIWVEPRAGGGSVFRFTIPRPEQK